MNWLLRRTAIGAVGAAYLGCSTLALSGQACDVNEGADVYANKCAVCHSIVAGQNGAVGPTLFGIVGRMSAGAEGFNYSPAIRALKEPWTAVRLDWFLQDPPGRVVGTYMAFSGLRNDAARAAVICYLADIR